MYVQASGVCQGYMFTFIPTRKDAPYVSGGTILLVFVDNNGAHSDIRALHKTESVAVDDELQALLNIPGAKVHEQLEPVLKPVAREVLLGLRYDMERLWAVNKSGENQDVHFNVISVRFLCVVISTWTAHVFHILFTFSYIVYVCFQTGWPWWRCRIGRAEHFSVGQV